MIRKIFGLFILMMASGLTLAACSFRENTNQSSILVAENTGNPENQNSSGGNGTINGINDFTPEINISARHGSWADKVVLLEEPSAKAVIDYMAEGEIDLYFSSISNLVLLHSLENNPDLTFSQSVGSSNELLFNPAGPVLNDGRLNPFAEPRMREAMNMFVNREYILEKFLGGLGDVKYLPITGVFPDYARIAEVAKTIEAQYRYNPEKAVAQMTDVLLELGAEKVDSEWTYQGEQIELIMVIRTEDERREYGDYISDLLEDFGFSVNRIYKNSANASRILYQSSPAEGLWHMYTGGWTITVINRDAAGDFELYYTPLGLAGYPPWDSMTPTQTFQDLATALAHNQFTSMEERAAMLAEIAPMAMEDSSRIWLYDQTSFTPRRAEIEVAADLAGAVAGTPLWTHTLKRSGEEGGNFTVAVPSMLDDPWNPVAGSNWIIDQSIIQGISDWAVIPDPYTGLALPQRVISAEVTIETGLPVGVTFEWVSLKFADRIEVPADAWADWDAATQEFITVGEKFPDGLSAKSRVICNYDETLYEKSLWHDGSYFTIADVVMYMIMKFELAKEESPIFDVGQVGASESWLRSDFRGWRIVSANPLVVEYYSDNFELDAENNVTNQNCGWPEYAQGQAPWHSLTIGILAETNQQLAFTAAKSQQLQVEWINFIGKPSLDILSDYLDEAAENDYIPFAPTLGQYITEEDAAIRYKNLRQFYSDYGHLWVGNGPMLMESVNPIKKSITLLNFPDFPDFSSKWAGYTEPILADVEISGPPHVDAGDEAVFDVLVTHNGIPYSIAEIDRVSYLLFNPAGALIEVGSAQAIKNGHFQIVLSSDKTFSASVGNRIEVIVVSKAFSIPTLETFDFVVEEN